MNEVERYLATLGAALPPRARSRIVGETRAHLADAIDAEVATGADPQDATRRAITRFGDPETVARRFAEEGLMHGSARTWRATAPFLILTALLAAFVMLPLSGGSTPWPNDALIGLGVAAGVQVAFVAGFFTAARRLAQRAHADASGASSVARGCGVGLAAGGLILVAVTAGIIDSVLRPNAAASAAGILVLVATGLSWLLFGFAVLRARRTREWVLAAGSREAPRPIGDLLDVWGVLRSSVAERAPLLGRTLNGVDASARTAIARIPRGVTAWLDVEAHPWRACATLSAIAGGWAFAGGLLHDAAAGDIAPLAGVATGATEALLVLVAFALLGPALGLRGGDRRS